MTTSALLAALVSVAGAAGAIGHALLPLAPAPADPAVVPLTAIAEGCGFEIVSPPMRDGADIALLETSEAVDLVARFRPPPAESRGPWREIGRRVEWSASAGAPVGEDAPTTDTHRLLWIPPADSADVSVEAVARIDYELEGSFPPAVATIRKVARVRILTPLDSSAMNGGILDGYRVGEYPRVATTGPPAKGQGVYPRLHPDRYERPKRFYRVDPTLRRARLSRGLTLGHFVIDFPWGSLGMPQYVAVDLDLVDRLEDLFADMRAELGVPARDVVPIYGFRPPAFNLGTMQSNPDTNLKVVFSMHQFGRALDFIVDDDGDLAMDDLNGDGAIDARDAAVVLKFVNRLDARYREAKAWNRLGGAGIYERHDFVGRPQTPYIHVDNRGFLSTGGNFMRWFEPPRARWPDGSAVNLYER